MKKARKVSNLLSKFISSENKGQPLPLLEIYYPQKAVP